MRNLFRSIWISIFFLVNFLIFTEKLHAENTSVSLNVRDSVLSQVLRFVPVYSQAVKGYESDVYMRGNFKVHKQNQLIRFVPSMFRLSKDVSDYVVESIGELHYTCPDIYNLKMHAYCGTFRRNRGELGNTMEFLGMNVYSATLLPGKLISPLDEKGSRYYDYRLDSVCGVGDSLRYYIHILPRNKSIQLVSGYMVVDGGRWTIREISLKGRVELLTFDVHITMGQEGETVLLPERLRLNLLFDFVGNKIEADYTAILNYTSVRMENEDSTVVSSSGNSKYDLTNSYRLVCDRKQAVEDTAYVALYRPYPLNDRERGIYDDYRQREQLFLQDTIPNKRKTLTFLGEVGDALISHYTLDLSDLGSVRCSPLINPLMVSYSHSNGFSYKQEFKYNLLFPNERWLRAVPRIGYNFTRKEFYWNVNAELFYWPERLAAFGVKLGNGNRIHTSRVMDEIKHIPDSLLDFDKLNLDYFRDSYLQIGHQIELVNGLELTTGVSIHRRTVIDKPEISLPDIHAKEWSELQSAYISFAPRLKLQWTPGQYYYMNGRRKIKLRSRYPTFLLDYERGLKGVLGSTGSYERTELDVQQQLPLSLMSKLSYRLGAGFFTNQDEVYFVDFANFTRNNLPVGWNDEIGGTFQLLDGHWYNSSRYYLRGHLTYEAPFLLVSHLKKYTRIIDSERLYAGFLFEERLTPYVELGYGIGTHIFDFGLFVNNVNGRFNEFGCKFTFELFSK